MFVIDIWDGVMHRQVCASNPAMIGSDNGLSVIRRQDIIGTNITCYLYY